MLKKYRNESNGLFQKISHFIDAGSNYCSKDGKKLAMANTLTKYVSLLLINKMTSISYEFLQIPNNF